MATETYTWVEKMWEGVDAVMERSKEGKKTFQELKARLESLSSLEKDNASNIASFSKKIQPLTENGNLAKIYLSLAELFTAVAASFKGIAEKVDTLPSTISSEMDFYTTTFEKNSRDLPSLKKKKQAAVNNCQQCRNKYIQAFRAWDKADEDYAEISKDTKTAMKKVEKEKKKADERKAELEKAWKKYSDAVDVSRKAEEAYNTEMNTCLVTCQKTEQKRLKFVSKTLSDTCIQFEDTLNTHLNNLNAIRLQLDGLDIQAEVDDFARDKNTRQGPQPLTTAVKELRRCESKNVVQQRQPVAYAPFSNQKPVAPSSMLPSIPVTHPLIIYATYDYQPTFPPYNPSKPNLDKNNVALPQYYSDIALKGNAPYLLTEVDYPWAEWCSITSLQFKEDESQEQVFEGEEKGCAPVSYFNSEYFEYARSHLQSNPDAAKKVFAIPSRGGGGGGGGGGGSDGGGAVPPPPPLNASGGGGGGGGGGARKTYTALYPYTDEEGLNIAAGETLYVPADHAPEPEGEEWNLIVTASKKQGYIPANYVQRNF